MSNEEGLVWGISLLVVAAVVLGYALAFRRRRRTARARQAEARRLGIDRPVGQYPFVDRMRCIGCGSCVDACPEGDVLAVVGGTATVVNGLRCIGHGRCELACPVGAIEVGVGDLYSRRDVPVLDARQETSVRGVYVAGELGGLALVRNAIAQARRVVDAVAEERRSAGRIVGGDGFDLVIVGAGPAGLTAAAAGRERGLSHVVLEQEADLGGTVLHYPRRKLVLVQAVDVPVIGRLREAEYSKEELLAYFERLTKEASLNVRFAERMSALERSGDLFAVRSSSGLTLGRNVLLALGRRGTPRKLGVPGEELPKVLYQLVDAESFRGQRILVVGGGDSAVEAAVGLARQKDNRVTLSYRREALVRIKKKNEERIASLIASGRVEALYSSEVLWIRDGSVRLRLPEGEVERANDWVFVFAGGDPPFDLLRGAGVRFGGDALAEAKPS